MSLAEMMAAYTAHCQARAAQGIPPLPLGPEQVQIITTALLDPQLDQQLWLMEGCSQTSETLLWLLDNRVPPGVYPASKIKAAFLGDLLQGQQQSSYLSSAQALEYLYHMEGGDAVGYLITALGLAAPLDRQAAGFLKQLVLISPDDLQRVRQLAVDGNHAAREVLQGWAAASWFAARPAVPEKMTMTVIRTTGEINTDFLSPAQEASTRDDIPLHALKILSTSPHDKDFLERRARLLEKGHPLLWAGDVVGTGSSRKSASNSAIWWLGQDIPHVPNKRRGGVIMASKIAPIFFNTVRGCGAIPVRCSTGQLQEGEVVTVDFSKGQVLAASGQVLTEFKVDPPSILDEARAGGRNFLIIGRNLTRQARQICQQQGWECPEPALQLPAAPSVPENQPFSLAQKLIGQAVGRPGVLPGEYAEPKAHLVFSQDTTGKMTQQETQELACRRYATAFIQSFCHTAAGPRSKDSRMQSEVTRFVSELGGIALRPGDGIIHTNGNRFLLPYFVGTGGDSHTRFPIGISFPAGSDLVAFAGSQGYFPLDMPASVLVKFKGQAQPGITIRDYVNAIPYTALQQGLLNLAKGDEKKNVFADRILEVQGLEDLTPEEAYKITDTSAERSAAAATFALKPERIIAYVENHLRFLENNFSKRCNNQAVQDIIAAFKQWLQKPEFLTADPGAPYAATLEVDLNQIKEPILAAPNDPDKAVLLSEAAGTKIDEVFIGSCMVDITDIRAAQAILEGERVQYHMKVWVVPPDRETFGQLAQEGVLTKLTAAGANIHVPGCSLCMGNQAQVATNATVISTSTRNFDNRMGLGAQVYLGSAHVAAVTALLGHLPTPAEYLEYFQKKVAPRWEEINQPLKHA